ncbi:MAG: ABC transporter substrate-binding protein [Actinomycetota bacterium]|nr:ABC transporter substrate-binding protein [Actinomycetota bacterium]
MTKAASAIGACALLGGLVVVGNAGAATTQHARTSYVNVGTFSPTISSGAGDIDPYQSTEGTARQIYAFGYDTLLARSSSGRRVSELAQSWATSPNNISFTLRKGVTRDDGSTLTATDVAKDPACIKNPKTISPWLSFAPPIDYALAADDATRTVTITTVKDFGLLLQGAGELPIVCPQGLSDPQTIHELPPVLWTGWMW